MKAPFTPNSAIEKALVILAFLPLVTVIYPATVAAAYPAQNVSEEKALVFEISSKPKTETPVIQTQTLLSYAELEDHYKRTRVPSKNELLAPKVRAYLESKGSPLAVYSEQIIQQPQWQRALAISYVESNFGKRCADNNCSGIGVKPGHKSWRKYSTKLDWFADMSRLLEKPIYKQKYVNCNTMKGVYVVPGSATWVNGCNKASNDLLAITAKAESEHNALSDASRNSMNAAAISVEIVK